MFRMRPSIPPVSQDASDRLRLLQEVHALARSVLQLHKDDMQARLEPSTAPRFVRGDKQVTVTTKHLFLRGQPERRLRDRPLGSFAMEEHIGKHNNKLKLPTTIRLHTVFHVNSLRPFSTSSLRPAVPVNVLEGDDEEFEVSHFYVVCIKLLLGRRGKYLLFMTHSSDDGIPHVWHRLNEVHRTVALQDFLETPQWHRFVKTQAYIDFMHAHPTRIRESQ
jgi:hypothetical protein